MRTVSIGGDEVTLVASPITLYIYKREFHADILGDIGSMTDAATGEIAVGNVSSINFMQMAWAMAKTAKMGASFPAFEQWLGALPYVDLNDSAMFTEIMSELKQGFFRSGKQGEAVKEAAQE